MKYGIARTGIVVVLMLFGTVSGQAQGDADAAEKQLRSLAEDHGSVQAWLQLARMSSRRGRVQEALGFLNRAREIAPNSEDVLSAYGRVTLAMKTPLPAVFALEPLTRMNPTVPEYFYLLGVARMQAGDMASAFVDLEKARTLEGERPLTLVALGLALNQLNRYEEAKVFLERGLELAPDDAEALAGLAEAEEGMGDLEAAETHARRALEKVPAHANAHLVVGMILMKRQEFAPARDAFKKAVAADSQLAKAHYQLSLAYARTGEREESKKHLALYRQARKEMEERARILRGETETPNDGN